jgi:hypothetical protein
VCGSFREVAPEKRMTTYPLKTGQMGERLWMVAKVPARVSPVVPGRNRSAIMIGLAQIKPKQTLGVEIEVQWVSGHPAENGSADEQSGEAHAMDKEMYKECVLGDLEGRRPQL